MPKIDRFIRRRLTDRVVRLQKVDPAQDLAAVAQCRCVEPPGAADGVPGEAMGPPNWVACFIEGLNRYFEGLIIFACQPVLDNQADQKAAIVPCHHLPIINRRLVRRRGQPVGRGGRDIARVIHGEELYPSLSVPPVLTLNPSHYKAVVAQSDGLGRMCIPVLPIGCHDKFSVRHQVVSSDMTHEDPVDARFVVVSLVHQHKAAAGAQCEYLDIPQIVWLIALFFRRARQANRLQVYGLSVAIEALPEDVRPLVTGVCLPHQNEVLVCGLCTG